MIVTCELVLQAMRDGQHELGLAIIDWCELALDRLEDFNLWKEHNGGWVSLLIQRSKKKSGFKL